MQHLCAFKGPRLSRLRSRAVPSLTSLFGSSATRAGERKCTQHSAHIWPDLRSLWPNSLAGFTTQAEAAPQSDAKQAEAVPQPDVSQPEAAPQSDVNQPEAAPQPGAKRAEANRSRPPIAYMDRPISTRSVHYHRLVSNHRYVDKTAYVSKLILFSNRLFISGGFGWGKSTTLSTLYTYFCGRKHCFEGTYLGTHFSEQKHLVWQKNPVLMFDFSLSRSSHPREVISEVIHDAYGRASIPIPRLPNHPTTDMLLSHLIETAANQGPLGKVVVLVDEFDRHIDRSDFKFKSGPHLLREFFKVIHEKNSRIYFMAAVARHETSGELCGYLRNVTNDSNVSRVFGFTYEEIKAAYPVELNRYAISKGISSEEVLQEHLFTEVLRVHTERLKFNPLQINRLLAPFSGKVAPTFT